MASKIAAMFGGGVVLLLVLELLLRCLPVSTATQTGYRIDPNILTYPPEHNFTTSFGWALERAQRQHANNFGFVADRDFVSDPHAIAVIGDSYVEGSMLPPPERLASQLELALHGRPVFAMGGPGSSLLDYVERVRFANSQWALRNFFIVVERGDIMQSLCGSGNVHAACLDRTTLQPRLEHIQAKQDAATNLLRHSALAQYFFTQLRVNPQQLVARVASLLVPKPVGAPPTVTDAGVAERQSNAVIRAFFERLEPYKDRHFTFVVGCDMAALRTGRASPDPARVQFMERARSWGARVVDTEPLFATHLNAGGLSLQVSPRDGHWNRLSNGMIVDSIVAGGGGVLTD